MKNSQLSSPVPLVLCLLVCAVFSFILSDESVAQGRSAARSPFPSNAEIARWAGRNRQFGRLWLSRFQHPDQTARAILPFALQKVETHADLRERAVVALGRIESPVVQKPLETLLRASLQRQAKNSSGFPTSVNEISPWSLKFALARINSRNMKGTKRLDFVARAVGTTWPSVRQKGKAWKRKLVDPRQRMAVYDYLRGSGSPRLMLEEFAQLLHDMGQKGDNVKSLGAMDLLVWPAGRTPNGGISALQDPPQTVILTANMTRQQEINFWLKRALPAQKDRAGSFSPQAFLDLGPPAVKALNKKLRELLVQAKRDPQMGQGIAAIGPRTLFEAAAASGDSSFIPILQDFTRVRNRVLAHYARLNLEKLRSGLGATILPRPKLYFGPVF